MKASQAFYDDIARVAQALQTSDVQNVVLTPIRFLAIAKMLNILRQDAAGLVAVEIEQISNDYYLHEEKMEAYEEANISQATSGGSAPSRQP